MSFVHRIAQAQVTPYEASVKWPRLLKALIAYVGFEGLAVRYLWKAARGEDGYGELVREAFAQRHKHREKRRVVQSVR